ncbi:MAG: fumarylacetoacetase [Granulosicoccus sp.]|nr:fumarylacetoacetase [Granulosicoccus sp.]
MTLRKSWLSSANVDGTDFPLNNLPYGVFSPPGKAPRCGVAIGDQVLDVATLEEQGILVTGDTPICRRPSWNTLMNRGPVTWLRFRDQLTTLMSEGAAARSDVEAHLYPLSSVLLQLPFTVSEYTDFYAGRHHATNVGTMFRGAENALPPNWLHMPIGYNGRASSVVVSGTPIRRPWGQVKGADQPQPAFMPSRRFDLELELGAIVGTPSQGPVSVDEADAMIFGYVLLNDWSARDIQAWEYQPLGPFQAKATATTISPWIVTAAALEEFRVHTPERQVPLLPYLADTGPMLYDLNLSVTLAPSGKAATTITATNYREMYYSAAQQLAHHSSSGCPMRTGDLLGSGTISGADKHSRGSLLELSWGGKEPLTLDSGETRSFLEDGDTLTLHGYAQGPGYRIGFGECSGTVVPALANPFMR